ncbi:phenylacetaldehyde dehydrogenase [Gulosibacter molinativorax]|uniref:Phenylacetaldehyde dehydrogenase n=2 Tax=Gulosibacter molinativorax TaxID=256821 RepID=A0ABT7C5L2_9MICO|nr:phenylacetaldehyde dehydrogenase [Gulosibacter molinativorax]
MLTDPNTGEDRQPKRDTDPADVERALASAAAIHADGTLEAIPLADRVALLNRVADALDTAVEAIAQQDSINTGTPIATARIIAGSLGDRVRGAIADAVDLGESETLHDGDRPVLLLHRPLGPALIVAPWNAPTFTVVGKVAAAIAAGCPVLLKPSQNAPGGCQLLSEIIVAAMAESGFPTGAFQLVHGSSRIGALLTEDPRIEVISFTGGDAAGRTVARAAGANLAVAQMELGSNNPAIILEDADVTAAADAVVAGMTRINGQWCEAPGKILVAASIHDAFVAAMRDRLATLQLGDALEEGTEVGPLAFESHRDALTKAVDRLTSLGGELVAPGTLPPMDGWFLLPGMVTGTRPEDATEELFGPLVTVHAVDSPEEALRHANGPVTGLDAFVFGSDREATLSLASRIRAGEVRINGTYMVDLAEGSRQTFWGTSGIGGHGPRNGVRFFLGDRVIGVDHQSAPL